MLGILLGDSVEHCNTGHTPKPTGAVHQGCPSCAVPSYETFDIHRNPYNHLHSSIDYMTYIKNNPKVKIQTVRKERGYKSFDYLNHVTIDTILNPHTRTGTDPNHLTQNLTKYLIQVVNLDYLKVCRHY